MNEPKRPRGNPNFVSNPDVIVRTNIALTVPTKTKLKAIAKQWGKSMSEVVRKLIEEAEVMV